MGGGDGNLAHWRDSIAAGLRSCVLLGGDTALRSPKFACYMHMHIYIICICRCISGKLESPVHRTFVSGCEGPSIAVYCVAC